MKIAGLRSFLMKKWTVVIAHQKHRKIDDLFSDRWGSIVRLSVRSEIKSPVKKTLTVTHGDRLLFVYTQHFGNVIAINLKIGENTQLVEALQGHQKNKSYRYDSRHSGKDKVK